jgi:spoIIIJ-associated protein
MRFKEERKNNFVLECKNFRKNRISALKKMAIQAGEKVKNNGRPYVFSPMTPAERRYIHLTLQEDRMLKTESLGDGFFKRVKVYLK